MISTINRVDGISKTLSLKLVNARNVTTIWWYLMFLSRKQVIYQWKISKKLVIEILKLGADTEITNVKHIILGVFQILKFGLSKLLWILKWYPTIIWRMQKIWNWNQTIDTSVWRLIEQKKDWALQKNSSRNYNTE